MKTVVSLRDLEQLLAKGQPLPANALLTPSARELWDTRQTARPKAAAAPAPAGPLPAIAPKLPEAGYKWTPGGDPKDAAGVAAFYASKPIRELRERICAIGERIWKKDYVDGNGGNILVRVGDNLFLCTPTLISKGFMEPDDICLIDFDGRQLAGHRPRTSECFTHLAIYRATPLAKATVHAHPPHATAFAVAAVQPPTCMIPEAEVFLGKIGYAPYQTPGTPANALAVGSIAAEHQSIIMENHGVICWGKDVEDAYWKMENTDAYCKTVWIASQLGHGLKTFTTGQLKDLIAIRQKLGMPDQRTQWKECELCDNSEFRPGVFCQTGAPATAPAAPAATPQQAEDLVRLITDAVLARLGAKS